MPGVKFRGAHADNRAMRQAAGLQSLRRAGAVLALVGVLAGATAAGASARDPFRLPHDLKPKTIRAWAMKRSPALVPVAFAQVKGKPVAARSMYLIGAVMGSEDYNACLAVQFARARLTKSGASSFSILDLAQLQAVGLSGTLLMTTFFDGVAFGCTYFG